jgi:RES domain-containing protein
MAEALRHERALLDALESLKTIRFSGTVWRIAQANRDPLRGSSSSGRWSGGDYTVLYTACEKDGALAEIGFRLAMEPIWPSKLQHMVHEIKVDCAEVLDLSKLETLEKLGVATSKYHTMDYSVTAQISAAAAFLEFDALLVPNARYKCSNLVIFNERPNTLELVNSTPVDWEAWRTKR